MTTKQIEEIRTVQEFQKRFNRAIFNTPISDQTIDDYPYEKEKHKEIYILLSGILKTRFIKMDINFCTFDKNKTKSITNINITSLSWKYEIAIKSLKFQYIGDSRKDCLKKYKKQFIEFFS